MTVELAHRRYIAKPWGVRDLGPWDTGAGDGSRIGEIWYERSGQDAPSSSLLLKLLFTTEQLSIQVHPSDAHAEAMGLPSGKTEAWHVLQAAPGAQVALGLNRSLTTSELRRAAVDGSLAKLVTWRNVWAGDTVFVPAGTIHSLGAGLVIAEIQQRSGTTFRLLDPDLGREVHVDQAVVVARAEPAPEQPCPRQLDDERTLLVCDSHFILERLELPARAERLLAADQETWLLVVGGSAYAGSFEVGLGTALFAISDRIAIKAGSKGMTCIVAYATTARPEPGLLQRVTVSDPASSEDESARRNPVRIAPATASHESNSVKETR